MKITCALLRQTIHRTWSVAVQIYATNNREGWRDNTLLFITCFTFSFLLCSLILLYLRYALDYGLLVASGIAGSCWIIVMASLFLSKQIRCFGVLFVLSCGMKQSRNLLITAGTSLVVLKNIKNTLENLTGLTRSMVCNLQAKRVSLDTTPLSNYVNMLKWVGDILRAFTDYGVVTLVSDLKVTSKVDSEKLRKKLLGTEKALKENAESIRNAMNTVSSVGQRVFPVFSFLLLMVFTAMHLRKYCQNKKFENMFITNKFIHFDEKQKAGGRPQVLPLTAKESRRYMTFSSTHLTAKEGKTMCKFSIPVVTHVLTWALFIGVDTLMYYFAEVIKTKLEELEPFNVPLLMDIKEDTSIIGVRISEETKRRDFSYSVALFEKKCLPKPKLLLYESILPLAMILTALIIMAMMSAKLTQLRLAVCEHFFSANAEERVEYLHAKILRNRSKRKERAEESSLRSLINKPDFWCPILFRPQGEDSSQQGN